MKLIWTEIAVEKLEEYADYIALDKPTTALKWSESIQESANKLIDFPGLGRQVPELKREDIREIIKGNYRIIYLLQADYISILTIRHCKQLLDKTEFLKKSKKPNLFKKQTNLSP